MNGYKKLCTAVGSVALVMLLIFIIEFALMSVMIAQAADVTITASDLVDYAGAIVALSVIWLLLSVTQGVLSVIIACKTKSSLKGVAIACAILGFLCFTQFINAYLFLVVALASFILAMIVFSYGKKDGFGIGEKSDTDNNSGTVTPPSTSVPTQETGPKNVPVY